jgi:Holliday junction DNA helicase RuvA
VALGYKQSDADRMVKSVASDGMASEDLIREALKAAAK